MGNVFESMESECRQTQMVSHWIDYFIVPMQTNANDLAIRQEDIAEPDATKMPMIGQWMQCNEMQRDATKYKYMQPNATQSSQLQ